MKFFNIFNSSGKQESLSFSSEQINSWPSLPGENRQVPSLGQIAEVGLFKNEASKVLEWIKLAEQDGDEVEQQVVMESQFGFLTLPALVKKKDGGFLVYYSHCSEWHDDFITKLLDWTVKLRSCDFVHSLKIEICDSPDALPLKVREIISKRTEHRMFLSMIPHLSQASADIRGRVFAEGFGHFFNENKILNFDRESLSLIESWFRKVVERLPQSSFYYQITLNLLGSYFGRVLKDTFGGTWGEGTHPELIISQKVKIRIHPYKIMADFIEQPGLENSPLNNMELLSREINERR